MGPFDPPKSSEPDDERESGLLRLAVWLVSPPEDVGTAVVVVRWWEVRRLPYNFIVAIVGAPFLIAVLRIAFECGASSWMDRGMPEPIFGYGVAAIVFGLSANLFFTAGWIVQLVIQRAASVRLPRFGPVALIAGTVFSAGLTLTIGWLSLSFAREFWCDQW